MTDYLEKDINAITVEEAMADDEWGLKPGDVTEYIGIDIPVLATFADFTDQELIETMRTVTAYYVDGVIPDYSTLRSAAVKIAVRSIIAGHQRRMNTAYLKRYKQYVGAKQRQARLRDKQNSKDS